LTRNFIAVPIIYFLYPETGFRSLEEVDVIFHAASLGPNPWLNVRKIAANEPLWYGKGGDGDMDEPFMYEETEWHKKHVRFSDEVKGSDSSRSGLKSAGGNSSSPEDASPAQGMDFVDRGLVGGRGREPSTGADTDDEYKEKDESPMDHGEDAAPAPFVARTSRDRDAARSIRSAGRGY
jgi:hypothetical protein